MGPPVLSISNIGLLESRLAQTFLPTPDKFKLTGLHCSLALFIRKVKI